MKARSLALATLHKYWNTTTIPVDPVRIATQMKIKVIADPQLKDSGSYTPAIGDNPAEISYNSSESLLSQRFTVAHEIGHHVMQHGASPREISENFMIFPKSPKEQSANIFAFHLLMPSDAIRAVISICQLRTVEKLAKAFCVSRIAMIIRLKEIGYHIN